MSIIYKDESYAIMGACCEVYKEKGSGFLEQVHQAGEGGATRSPFVCFVSFVVNPL